MTVSGGSCSSNRMTSVPQRTSRKMPAVCGIHPGSRLRTGLLYRDERPDKLSSVREVFCEQSLVYRCAVEDVDDQLSRIASAVRAAQFNETIPIADILESPAGGVPDLVRDRIDELDVGRVFPSSLPHANVHHGQSERGSLDDAGARVTDEYARLAQQADPTASVEVVVGTEPGVTSNVPVDSSCHRVVPRVAVRSADDDDDIESCECIECGLDSVCGILGIHHGGMLNYDRVRACGNACSEVLPEFFRGGSLGPEHPIHAGGAYVADSPRFLAHTFEPSGAFGGCCHVEVSEPCDRMPGCIVDVAVRSGVASSEMDNGPARIAGGDGTSECFFAIPQEDHEGGIEAIDGLREA